MRMLLALVCLAFVPAVGAESGVGTTGEWSLVWRHEDGAEMNRFREQVGDVVPFPFRSRVLREGATGRRLAFVDLDGNLEGGFPLEPTEDVVVARDGRAWLRWSRDPVRRGLSLFRYFRAGDPEPAWEATASGEPLLFAEDGSLFVLAWEDTARDAYDRASLERAGRTQLVGAGGEVRAELPVQPTFARLTGDGSRLVLFRDEELLVLMRDGTLAWTADVPIDHLLARDGHDQLDARAERIVVAGTGGETGGTSRWSLHAPRVGRIRVFDDEGRLQWSVDQPEDEPLWFQISPCLSEDGTTLVTVHSEAGHVVVRAWDAGTGDRLWTRREARRTGVQCISMTPDGQLIALTHGENRTRVKAWDREGALAWEGTLPYRSRMPRLAAGGVLVAQRWIVRLLPPADDGA